MVTGKDEKVQFAHVLINTREGWWMITTEWMSEERLTSCLSRL